MKRSIESASCVFREKSVHAYIPGSKVFACHSGTNSGREMGNEISDLNRWWVGRIGGANRRWSVATLQGHTLYHYPTAFTSQKVKKITHCNAVRHRHNDNLSVIIIEVAVLLTDVIPREPYANRRDIAIQSPNLFNRSNEWVDKDSKINNISRVQSSGAIGVSESKGSRGKKHKGTSTGESTIEPIAKQGQEATKMKTGKEIRQHNRSESIVGRRQPNVGASKKERNSRRSCQA